MNSSSEKYARFIPSFICTHKKHDIYTLSSGREGEDSLDFFLFSPPFTALLLSLQCDYMSKQLDYGEHPAHISPVERAVKIFISMAGKK